MNSISLDAARNLVEGIDVTDQAQIDELKTKHAGAGIGPCVQERLSAMIVSGEINTASSIPTEYRKQLSYQLR